MISNALSRFLQTTTQLRTSEKARSNAEKEVNRAIAGSKKDNVYAAEDADKVLTLMDTVQELDKKIDQLTRENEQLNYQIREYLVQLGGSVDFTESGGSIINFSVNEYHEVVLYPN